MGHCEFCGKESNSMVKVKIESSVMNACQSCSKLGKVVEEDRQVYSHTFTQKKKKIDKNNVEVVQDYSSKINTVMGKRGINMKQLANTLNIKDTTLQKYLSGKVKMDVDTARKFENYFEIKLTEEVDASSSNASEYMEEKSLGAKGQENQADSLGDLLMRKLQEKNKK